MECQGVGLVMVYGDPKYYSRHGFTAHHHVIAPYELTYPDAWMAYEITPDCIANARGVAECAAVLRHPQYW
jgi:putative acetyltransferase